MNFKAYRIRLEKMPNSEGGGFRIYYPTLGFSLYGIGDTISEALSSLSRSQESFLRIIEKYPDTKVPNPSPTEFYSYDT